ncbi:MAG: hypothetical protein HYV45_01220 [Candidatus Moranbacteria bacterium]|nr:hypothetical protein [Candidatus Moranbacteria bacterium]
MNGFLKYGIVSLVFIFGISFSFLTISFVSAANGPVKRVLLINSYDQSYKWTAQITQSVKEKLDVSGIAYDLQVENMDTKRVNDETSRQLLFEQFKYKFGKFKYDIVLTSDDDAFNFTLKHRGELFPDTPVVFCGTNFIQNRLDIIKDQKLISGINEDSDIEASVDIALKLQSGVRNIFFIRDSTTTGKIVGDYIDKLIPKYEKDYAVTVYDGSLSGDEILNAVRQMPENSLIYVTIFNASDKTGRYYGYSELLKEIRAETDVPIYGTWDFNLGDGIVGGKLTSSKAQGGAMADIAVRVLNGENIENIPIVLQSPNVYAFDYRELIAHKSDRANIPPGSVIINQPESFYAKYREYVWVGVAVFILLIALVVALFVRNRFHALKLAQSVIDQEQLEKVVSERTAALQTANKAMQVEMEHRKRIEKELLSKNEELESFNTIAVNRELEMIKLKKKVQELENQITKP